MRKSYEYSHFSGAEILLCRFPEIDWDKALPVDGLSSGVLVALSRAPRTLQGSRRPGRLRG